MADPVEQQPESPEETDEPDPRVQIELERLNHAAEAINHLELQLDEARRTFREFQGAVENELSQLEKKIGAAVGKARSYYDARLKLRDDKEALMKAKHRFERAQALHVAAKELAIISVDYIDEAEKANKNAATWNETYRHAIAQAADAEREKFQADLDQQRAEKVFSESENQVEKLQKDFRRSINKSKPYYEMKAEYHKEFDFQKRKVYGLETCVHEAKSQYQQSLRSLERISNEIHEQRNQNKARRELGERTSGVGEENVTSAEPVPLSPAMDQTTPLATAPATYRSDELLRSCLLRTESLPAGIFVNANDRLPPEGDETRDDYLNDQFILCPKAPPKPIILTNSEGSAKPSRSTHQQLASCSSHLTDDEEDKGGSLHVLSDEQLNHLASVYRDQPEETDALDELISQFQKSKLQAKVFFRNLFKSNSLNN